MGQTQPVGSGQPVEVEDCLCLVDLVHGLIVFDGRDMIDIVLI